MTTKCPKCQHENPENTNYCGKCAADLQPEVDVTKPYDKIIDIPVIRLSKGTVFANRYEVIEELGQGGMGKVYRVKDQKINEEVALKLIRPEIALDKKTIERFSNELKIARKITHKNVCRMYDINEEKDKHYITMEYVPGEDLKSFIRRSGQLGISSTIKIAIQICEGLAEAHHLGIVHRDLKPQNIMINEDGSAFIMDFGIARSLKDSGLTQTGIIMGSPHYMSPEQIEERDIDQRSDIYSFGIILYEMLTGDLPFKGETPISIGIKKKTEIPIDPRTLNPQIQESLSLLILKCMDRDRQRRYQTIESVTADFKTIQSELSSTVTLKSPGFKKKKFWLNPKNKFLWIAAAAAVTAFVVFMALSTRQGSFRSQRQYENMVLLDVVTGEFQNMEDDLIDYLFLRSLSAATDLNVIVDNDYFYYKKRTEAADIKIKSPLISVQCQVSSTVTGLEFFLVVKNMNETARQKFECRGPLDLLSDKIDQMLQFISEKTDGLIGPIEGDRTFAQICTPNYDALMHFLRGEKAWSKLDSETAQGEFRSAIENDPDFSLARLKYADVLNFRNYRNEAAENLELAEAKKERLIKYDILRLNVLKARIEDKKSEERQYLGRLKEAFPLVKEYHYEYAESYFHVGNPREAIKHYSVALELDPLYSVAYNHLAFCYSWLGEHNSAIQHFTRYVELDNTANSYDSLATGYMFSGQYDRAIEELDKGKEFKPIPDYLYGNIARNYVLKGALSKAEENLQEQTFIADRESVKNNIAFNKAYIEYVRGNLDKTIKELIPVREFYSQDLFQQRVDESPNLPFWLEGVAAAKNGNRDRLMGMIAVFGERISNKNVNATNYFPVYKFYLHLKILEGVAKRDETLVLTTIEEGIRIKEKMGYWSSMFNLPYFFNLFAEALLAIDRPDDALLLLNEAVLYNPNHAAVRLSLAKVYLQQGQTEMAKTEYTKLVELLSDADEDFFLMLELKKIKNFF